MKKGGNKEEAQWSRQAEVALQKVLRETQRNLLKIKQRIQTSRSPKGDIQARGDNNPNARDKTCGTTFTTR